MSSSGRTYVGFGFGAIQAGLFLYEAQKSGAFERLAVAELVPEVVNAVRCAGGHITLNIAHSNHIEQVQIGPITILDVNSPDDRLQLIELLAAAREIGTAVPDVQCYASDNPGSLHSLLAEGLRRKAAGHGPPAIIYAAENHNHAAEILASRVMEAVPPAEQQPVGRQVRFLNTVIGKMSGVISDPAEVRRHHLATMTPAGGNALLVEAFNNILISRLQQDPDCPELNFDRGISSFEEKDNLLPFEEAKLYGHNATHALGAYVGALIGVTRMADLPEVPGAMAFLGDAFCLESGAAIVRKHCGIDPLFTTEGYRLYADDLLRRMTNPFLLDTVERVARAPARKLGWNDRLIGTIRLALEQGVNPRRYAFGAAAAMACLDKSLLAGQATAASILDPLWSDAAPAAAEKAIVISHVQDGLTRLRQWLAAGRPRLDTF